jgi:hypothetical protein
MKINTIHIARKYAVTDEILKYKDVSSMAFYVPHARQ